MDSWSEGYVAEVGYTHGYYPELNPLRLKLALLFSELAFPAVETACELGFGQGLSIATHAAASPVQWHGTDFNPAQASQALDLVRASGASARLRDEAFADYCHRTDLPDFDFIALHGIWTWVSEANRELIVAFLQHKLKPGGAVFMSFNTLPGWSTLAPVRRLMADHLAVATAPADGMGSRIDASLAFIDQVLAANPAFAASAADLSQRVSALKTLDKGYLAHEYFNRSWQPMYFSEVAEWMSRAKLGHACSARYLDHIDALNLTQAQRTLLGQIGDSTLRKTTRDFLANTQFRKDYWVKGARQLKPFEQLQALREQRVVLVTARSEVSLSISAPTGEANLAPAIYSPLLDALADHRPRSLAELETLLAAGGVTLAQIGQAVMVLAGQGHVVPAHDEADIQACRTRTDALNLHLMHKARSSAEVTSLASPVTGGGVGVPRISQLFLLARRQGHADAEGWARFAWQVLASQGQALIGKDGKPMTSEADNMAQLAQQARSFADKQLPLLQALQVA